MQLTKTITIDATADEVWDLFAHRFVDVDEWMAAAPRSYEMEGGERLDGATSAGRIIEMRADGNGMKTYERFTAYDEDGKTCSIRLDFVDAPRLFPLEHTSIEFSVSDDPAGGSTATWVFATTINPWGYTIWPMLRTGMVKGWKQECEEFQHFVETGTPHPRKVKATGGE